MNHIIRPIILSGGAGTRLWPVSRKNYPKQFAELVDGGDLFSQALSMVSDRRRFAAPMIISNFEHRFLVRDALEKLEIHDATVILEPVGRNTAAAAYIAAMVEARPRDELKKERVFHLVMPSDHVITDPDAFMAAIDRAVPAVDDGYITLFGMQPTRPETGYGYILAGDHAVAEGVKPITCFYEKPDVETAKDFIRQGALWNSGIFFYNPVAMLDEAKPFNGMALDQCHRALGMAYQDIAGLVLDADTYHSMVSIAFDRAVMERTSNGAVVACGMGWSDLGSWEALWQIENKNTDGNVVAGPAVLRDSHDCYIRSDGATVATLGVYGMAIVATKDAILVAPRQRAQEIRELVDDAVRVDKKIAEEHPKVLRPWGSYESIAQGNRFLVKHIVVAPGRSLSLQMHHHRAEHWVVVAGEARVECDGAEKIIEANQSVYIPQGAKHRLSNPGTVDLHLIEVQSGDYIGEDDIVRYEDLYGRGKTGK